MWLLDEYGVYGRVRGWDGTGFSWIQVWEDVRGAIRRLLGVAAMVIVIVEAGALLLKLPRLDEPNMLVRENTRIFKERSSGTPALEYVFRALYMAPVVTRFDRALDAWLRGKEDPGEIVKPIPKKEAVTVLSLATWDPMFRERYPPKRDGARSGEHRTGAGRWRLYEQRWWGIVLSVWLVLFLGLIHFK